MSREPGIDAGPDPAHVPAHSQIVKNPNGMKDTLPGPTSILGFDKARSALAAPPSGRITFPFSSFQCLLQYEYCCQKQA